MQDPRAELPTIISILTSTSSPSLQRATLRRFYTADAAFAHPLCRVAPGPCSRERILGVYQWYRVLCPVVKAEVVEVSWDQHPGGHPKGDVHGAEIVGEGNGNGSTSAGGEGNTVYVQVVQWCKLRISPFAAAPARLTVRLTLREGGGLYYIAAQEDFYHPADLAALLIPPITPLITLALSAAGVVSNVGARVAALAGVWAVGTKSESGGEHMLDAQ
ncbi:hypothetical protein FIBSPDRAFT_922371 [Athelia psychrophila]|uniref:SigF-like NTF2-like domain-containing protein n=1 Tax=Athelia psychrophila TaxID=1759441 RepID=A0A165Z8K7_9AGAM|nr:hypothetical protein FIBSPDRAFT_922371 [Fibularhizoctonia sp. CBS 109695]